MPQTPAAKRWSAIIDRQEASGLTIRQFAKDNDLNPGTLTWWRTKLKRNPRKPADKKVDFLSVAVSSDRPATKSVVLALDNLDAHVVVDRDTDMALLRDLLGALC